jgi:hypothetical protein
MNQKIMNSEKSKRIKLLVSTLLKDIKHAIEEIICEINQTGEQQKKLTKQEKEKKKAEAQMAKFLKKKPIDYIDKVAEKNREIGLIAVELDWDGTRYKNSIPHIRSTDFDK